LPNIRGDCKIVCDLNGDKVEKVRFAFVRRDDDVKFSAAARKASLRIGMDLLRKRKK
jgi:hypothetical protein